MIVILVSFAANMILKIFDTVKMPPLLSVLLIAAMYVGSIECIIWCVQISRHFEDAFLLYILPFNILIIYARTIRDVVVNRIQNGIEEKTCKDDWMLKILNNAKNWPWLAIIFTAPLLCVLVVVLLLFGQKPDTVIKMWTETADWTFSTKIPPQNVYYDYHYLCTVAAGGHKNIVKPLRIGIRHGHRVVVNRQLMVANAFEQLLEEKTPRFHKVLRTTYDNVGYPIAKHINSPFTADAIYFLMKPLEWFFLIILYLFDVKPENRIAVQYPHSAPPIVK